MLPVSRLAMTLILTFLAVIAIPVALGGASPFEDVASTAPVILIAEIVIYFVSCFLFNARLSIVSIATISVVLFIARAVGSILAVMVSEMMVPAGQTLTFILAWVGNPVAVLLQMAALMIATPFVLEALGAEGAAASPAQNRGKRTPHEVAPAGGFVQVFDFEALSGYVRKTPGLEGFLILSSEGLLVWRDLPARLMVDEIAARLQTVNGTTGALMETSGLARLRHSMLQTREHLIVYSELNQNFSLILFYNSRTSLADCESRLAIVSRTAREFLQWKYPGLSLSGASISQTSSPTGT